MAPGGLKRLCFDLFRGLASLILVLAGLALIVGHATPAATTPISNAVIDESGFDFASLSDTLALLRRDRPAIPDPLSSLSHALGPWALMAGQFRDRAESLSTTFRRLISTPSVMPTQGWLSSQFSRNRLHPVLGYVRPHKGIDVRAPRGTPIEAPAAGTVISAGWEGNYGYTVEIDHGWDIVTRYAHVSKMLVKPGYRVQRGEVIALVGQTGLADGPHLHYEVRIKGRPVDPIKYVVPAVLAD
jgi:murein DD-endopeptidase MepM/ murein hydrolase activator NlpD